MVFVALVSINTEAGVHVHQLLGHVNAAMYVGYMAELCFRVEDPVRRALREQFARPGAVLRDYELQSDMRRIDEVQRMVDGFVDRWTSETARVGFARRMILECSLLRTTDRPSSEWINLHDTNAWCLVDSENAMSCKRLVLLRALLHRTPYAEDVRQMFRCLELEYDQRVDAPNLSMRRVLNAVRSVDERSRGVMWFLATVSIRELMVMVDLVAHLRYIEFLRCLGRCRVSVDETRAHQFLSFVDRALRDLDQHARSDLSDPLGYSKTMRFVACVVSVIYSHTLYAVAYESRGDIIGGALNADTDSLRRSVYRNALMRTPCEFNLTLPRDLCSETVAPRINAHRTAVLSNFITKRAPMRVVEMYDKRPYVVFVSIQKDSVGDDLMFSLPLTVAECVALVCIDVAWGGAKSNRTTGVIMSTAHRTVMVCGIPCSYRDLGANVRVFDGGACFRGNSSHGVLIDARIGSNDIGALVTRHLSKGAAPNEEVDVAFVGMSRQDCDFFDQWKEDIARRIADE